MPILNPLAHHTHTTSYRGRYVNAVAERLVAARLAPYLADLLLVLDFNGYFDAMPFEPTSVASGTGRTGGAGLPTRSGRNDATQPHGGLKAHAGRRRGVR